MIRLQLVLSSAILPSSHLTFLTIMADVLSPPRVESKVQKELRKAAKDAKPLEGDQLISAIDTMTEQAEENESALIQEMKQLSDYALDIENEFRKVTQALTNVKTNVTSANMREKCTTLHKKWSEHHTEYVEFLWISCEVAGKARLAVQDFSKDLLPYIQDPTESIDSKKAELQNQKKKIDQDRSQAVKLSQKFNNLSDKINAFTDDFEAMIKKFNIPERDEKFEEFDVQLRHLNDTLKGLNKKITILVAKLAIYTPALGITALLGFLCPHFWIKTAIVTAGTGVSSLIKAQQERDDTKRSIKETETKRDEAKADLEAMPALRATLTEIKPSTEEICMKLCAFSNVWATIRADIQEIEEKIDYAEITTNGKLFLSRVKAIQTLYELLAKGLYQYERVVTKNGNQIFAKRSSKKSKLSNC
ncbi:hypothetical protein EV421DRAFT_1852789 [Armillaria borealis]|uniref:Uncharacterized protein n=1 Tax=Armillaria borealis TaxID=47425 RepID=A0AA39IZC5_9AGAR|nr:hypothetical protein EV421DRAFT_1852789 [Armillaria borealis]